MSSRLWMVPLCVGGLILLAQPAFGQPRERDGRDGDRAAREQPTPREQMLERQVRELQEQLQHLKGMLEKSAPRPEAARPPAPQERRPAAPPAAEGRTPPGRGEGWGWFGGREGRRGDGREQAGPLPQPKAWAAPQSPQDRRTPPQPPRFEGGQGAWGQGPSAQSPWGPPWMNRGQWGQGPVSQGPWSQGYHPWMHRFGYGPWGHGMMGRGSQDGRFDRFVPGMGEGRREMQTRPSGPWMSQRPQFGPGERRGASPDIAAQVRQLLDEARHLLAKAEQLQQQLQRVGPGGPDRERGPMFNRGMGPGGERGRGPMFNRGMGTGGEREHMDDGPRGR